MLRDGEMASERKAWGIIKDLSADEWQYFENMAGHTTAIPKTRPDLYVGEVEANDAMGRFIQANPNTLVDGHKIAGIGDSPEYRQYESRLGAIWKHTNLAFDMEPARKFVTGGRIFWVVIHPSATITDRAAIGKFTNVVGKFKAAYTSEASWTVGEMKEARTIPPWRSIPIGELFRERQVPVTCIFDEGRVSMLKVLDMMTKFCHLRAVDEQIRQVAKTSVTEIARDIGQFYRQSCGKVGAANALAVQGIQYVKAQQSSEPLVVDTCENKFRVKEEEDDDA